MTILACLVLIAVIHSERPRLVRIIGGCLLVLVVAFLWGVILVTAL